MRTSRLDRFGAVATFAIVVGNAATLDAQANAQTATQSGDVAPGAVHACYVPVAGVLYLIKQPGLLVACLTVPVQHPEISWNREGPRGDNGERGPAGPPGAPGQQGDKGPAGPPGAQGPIGDQGPAGDKGPAGAPGVPGDKGLPGDKGPDGAPGPVGDPGPLGDKGPAGAQGPVGDTGPGGDAGPAGAKGLTGDKGPTGDQGPVGEKGPAGEQGVGDKGPMGEKGPTGDKGPTGEPGPSGQMLPCDNGCVITPFIANLAVTSAKLATITAPGKIANSATSATAANIASRIVARDGVGFFAMGGSSFSHNMTVTGFRLGAGSVISHAGITILHRQGGLPETSSTYAGPAAGRGGVAENTGVGSNSANSTTQGGNTAMGLSSLDRTGGGVGNTAIGLRAMELGVANGGFNVAVGAGAGRNIGVSGPSLGARNIVLGAGAGNAIVGASNSIHVANAGPNELATIRIGSNHLRAFIAGIDNSVVNGAAVQVNVTTGQLGIPTSSARFKVDVRDVGDASAALRRLHPVSYRYRREVDPSATLHYGLIAEEVDRVAPDLVVRDSTARPYTVRYEMLVPLLVSEIQRRQARLAALRQESAALLLRLERLEVAARP